MFDATKSLFVVFNFADGFDATTLPTFVVGRVNMASGVKAELSQGIDIVLDGSAQLDVLSTRSDDSELFPPISQWFQAGHEVSLFLFGSLTAGVADPYGNTAEGKLNAKFADYSLDGSALSTPAPTTAIVATSVQSETSVVETTTSTVVAATTTVEPTSTPAVVCDVAAESICLSTYTTCDKVSD